MSNKLYEESDVQAIANAIRTKNGSSDTYMVSEMAQAVLDIPQGTTPTGTKQITIDSAGTTTENVSAYANAEITVPQGQYKPNIDARPTTPSISVSNGGLITAELPTQFITDLLKPSFTEGYIESSDVSMTVKIGGSATRQLNTVNGQTVTPSQSQQSIAVQGDFVLGAINVAPIPSQYIIPTGTKSITANGTGIDVSQYASVDVNVSGASVDLLDTSLPTGDYTTHITTATIYCAAKRDNIDTLYAPNLTKINSQGFRYSGFKRLYAPNANIQPYANHIFRECPNLEVLALPSMRNYANAYSFMDCPKLTALDIWGFSGADMFVRDALLTVLILRSTSMVALGNINYFNNTPFASGKSGGTLYVPNALKSSYQSATNWSTILGYANNSIVAIEGSQYENYYADGTPIT